MSQSIQSRQPNSLANTRTRTNVDATLSKTMIAPAAAASRQTPTNLSTTGSHSLASTQYSLPPAAFNQTQPLASKPAPTKKSRSNGTMPSTAPKSPTGSADGYLKAAFKIGSTHGRINFENEERVFHRSDVPEKAREAHAYITKLLQTNLLAKHNPNWDSSITSGVAIRGSKHCAWETEADTFDDRFYHRIESEALVGKAKQRVDLIRQGIDPDFDPENVNPRWNVSTFVEERGPTLLSSKQGVGSPERQHRPIKFVPPDHKTLIQLQTDLNLHTRHKKAADAIEKAERAALEASWNSFRLAEHVDGSPALPPLPVKLPNPADVAKSISQQYPNEALQTFLWQQENPEAAAAAGLAPLSPTTISLTDRIHKHAAKPSVHHQHRTERAIEKQSLPYSSKVPPAWYRIEARNEQIAQSRAEAPYPKFAHPGVYEWVPAEDQITSGSLSINNEHKEWTVGHELSAAGGSNRWSCCLHPLRDAHGCTATGTDPLKRRIVVARSDDPTSVAALGLSSSKVYTSNSHGLDSSHVRARSEAAAAVTAAFGAQSSPTMGGTATSTNLGLSSGMGLSGPGVAIVKRYLHTGRFEPVPATKELMWSCCGALDKDAQGCTSKTVAKEHKWQVESIPV